MIKIKLTKSELAKAKYIADRWNTTTGKYSIKWNQDKSKVRNDTFEGVKYEMVVAKYLGIEYTGDIGQPGKLDVGKKYEVRGTKYQNGNLLLHPEDKEAPYILVTGENDTYNIIGWIMGSEGKKDRFWREDVRYPCYFVPQSELKPINKLI